MVLSLTDFQNKLQNRIFDALGSNIIMEVVTSTTTDKWGKTTFTYATSTTVVGVPYNQTLTEDFRKYSDLQVGELEMVLPYSTTFGTEDGYGDKITFDGETWYIKRKERYPYLNGNVAWALLLSKNL